tara:strand:- start:1181 stop:1492 length:312 start_codon:yes stop_codon:yes gene_type:complete
MAEGDVGGLHPTIEMIVALFVEMASAIVFGYIIGSLTSILSREDRSRVMINEKIDEITSYMQSRGIDELLQKRVVAYYDQVCTPLNLSLFACAVTYLLTYPPL